MLCLKQPLPLLRSFIRYKPGTVGIPFVHTTIKIVEPGTEKELPYGERGEVCINAPCTMIGYYKQEEETRNVLHIHEDGKTWVHTGDIGVMDEDGFLKIVGRIKRMILTSENDLFHKVFPKLLEEELLTTGVIQSISIVGKPNLKNTNDLIAFIVLNQSITEDQAVGILNNHAKESLESFERPTCYVVIDKMPLTTVGKVDYRTLEKWHFHKINCRIIRKRNNPFGTKGALLYRGKPCMCALRGGQSGHDECPGCFASLCPVQGAEPLAIPAVSIPAHFAVGTICWRRQSPPQSLKISHRT